MSKSIAVVLSIWWCQAVHAQTEWNKQQQDVVNAIEGYRAAWNSFDAELLASFCDEDCDRIDARGNIYRGRDQIFEHYNKVFSSPAPEGTKRNLTYDIFSVRLVGNDVAVVDARYRVIGVGPKPTIAIDGMNTVVLIKKDGNWLRAAHRQRIPFDAESL